ncbi:hypothetical protein Bealeia1_00556 [Candidatus Bealeia paramacronuclearis]|uniref:Uncharacterized protein n=1 Tax=Candidatus Bealeia paramacronuclearis TaxID=1921001 RepID=A0ABZ2C1J6_9PROT|nr:hypothetical protein [Candidatus Bealeia paramacronuclearis]
MTFTKILFSISLLTFSLSANGPQGVLSKDIEKKTEGILENIVTDNGKYARKTPK